MSMAMIRFWWALSLGKLKGDMRRAFARFMRWVKPWVHTPNDGRGARSVYVDGQPVEPVLMADTKKGVVRCYHVPHRINHKREVARTYKRRGHVIVVPMSAE